MDWYNELLRAPATPAESRADRPTVTASEVGNYMFCGRAWWLRSRLGAPSEALPLLADGYRRHAAAGATARSAEPASHDFQWALIGAIAFAVCALGVLLAAR